ncbi:MAG: acyl-CoA dehydrogenase family protein [Burkholderiales bacterium]|nr:acyl-CoA dehydrogenase family protein [Burkholderiales bacterium]
MYDLQLTAEQLGIRDAVRAFVRGELKPAATNAQRLEPFEKPLLAGLLRQASGMGLRALALSEEAGGTGADNLTACIVLEELAAGDVDLAATLGTTSAIARLIFDETMSAGERARHLPAFVSDDDCHLAWAGHDPEIREALYYHRAAGPEPARASAVEQENGEWVVNGTFPFVANAPVAKLIAVRVAARDRAGGERACVALLPVSAPGLEVRALGTTTAGEQPAVAWHHGPGGGLALANCRVPAHEMLGAVPQACARFLQSVNVQAAAMNIGIGQAAYEAALDYAKLRRQGGRNIVEHEAIGALLGDMAIRLEAARATLWRAAWALDHPAAAAAGGVPPLPLHHVARVFAAESIRAVTESAAECFGAMGVMRDMPLQKYVHDSLVFLHGEPGAGAARLLVAEAAAGYERPGRR